MDTPEAFGSRTVREVCRYISATNRWYTLVYERPMYDAIPKRCELFPVVLRERETAHDSYVLEAQYADGAHETFTGFPELAYRFSARQVEIVIDPYNQEEMGQ